VRECAAVIIMWYICVRIYSRFCCVCVIGSGGVDDVVFVLSQLSMITIVLLLSLFFLHKTRVMMTLLLLLFPPLPST